MPCTVELVCVDPSRINEIWPHVRPLLKAAIDRTGLSLFGDLERDVRSGHALVWLAWNAETKTIEAAVATALQPTEAGLVCLVMACGGSDMKRWLSLLKPIEQYARAEGCKRSRIVGRKGWLRALPDYQEKYAVMDKEF
jgi:hypothetical protein